jgi:flavodoxin
MVDRHPRYASDQAMDERKGLMLKVTVLFESLYGNTAAIADAIAAGLRPDCEVDLRPVDGGGVDADLLVVGAPTHVHGLPSARSRKALEEEAAKREAKGEALEYHPTASMRRFIDDIRAGEGRKVACFDTRFDRSLILTGSAARTMARKLRSSGYEIVRAPESFFVVEMEGPLAEGEVERAKAWGASLVTAVLGERP